ncbi:integrin alpha-8-like isoform X2 [Watersipora subatra]|uniref:integrin alpha-8-like isoform X2 n=1 Tax=Watersipora subatra TaxID=2589382 RepID=UPI00355C3203
MTTFVQALALISLATLCQGFMLDLETAHIFSDNDQAAESTMFGYTLAFLNESLLVGAPHVAESQHPNIIQPGGVYSCNLEGNQQCSLLNVDSSNNNIATAEYDFAEVEDRSFQWIGASLTTDPTSGFVCTCAPRFVYKSLRARHREPTGMCYYSYQPGASKDFEEYSPCRTMYDEFFKRAYEGTQREDLFASYHKTGHGMCGFSVALGPNNQLGIGAPGNYYFHGSLYSASPVNDYQDFVSTKAGVQVDDNSYMSWDIKFGEFDDNPDTVDYVVSMPRSNQLKGKLVFWSQQVDQLAVLPNITGYQPGAYFGYAIAVGNFEGTAGDDVVAGSPLYAHGEMPEVGQVHAFYQRKAGQQVVFTDSEVATGEDAYGRFGMSLANVGDLNLDGYDELMVGAPYAGPDKRGVVFLYAGSFQGLSDSPIQVIYSEDVSTSPPLYTFGWSIAGNMDVDDNKFVDVAVGAYKSNSAVLLKSRPIIELSGTLRSANNKIQLPVPCSDVFDKTTDGKVLLDIEICVSYDAVNDPGEIVVTGKLMFDSATNGTKRAFDVKTGLSYKYLDFALQKLTPICYDIQGYIQANIRDKTSPLNISIDFELSSSTPYEDGGPAPILDQLTPPALPIQLEFFKSCEVCSPDLLLDISTPTEFYVLGTDDKIDMTIQLGNSGEDSYLTTLNITLPNGVSYVNLVLDEYQCLPISCQQVYVNDTMTNYVVCEVGNPFPARHFTAFTVAMRLENIHEIDETDLLFGFVLDSSYADDLNTADNTYNLTIPLRVEASIKVTGNSKPADAIIYNDTHIESHRGPAVEHKYEIYTDDPSVIGYAELSIFWPIMSKDRDQYILYMYKFPEVIQGNARCSVPAHYINPQNISSDGFKVITLDLSNQRQERAVSADSQITCENDNFHCIAIQCQITNLRKEQSVIVKIHSFLWMGSVFKELTSNYMKEAVIKSTATATVIDVPYAIKPKDNLTATFSVPSYFEKYKPPKALPPRVWKWIAVGIGGGLVLLIIIIIILWKCGFFKRYRPYAEAKREKHKDGQIHEVERLYSSYN